MNSQEPLKAPLDLRTFVTFRLSRLQSQINSQAQHILRTYSDIGQSEWRVLVLVADRGVSTMAHIVRDGQMDKAQVSRAVKSLVQKGYLVSKVDPEDQRQSLLNLTDAGMVVHDTILPKMRDRNQHILEHLSEQDIARIYDIIDRLEEGAQRRDF